MHAAAMKFVQACVNQLPPRLQVLEYGGRNINGSVRGLFNSAVTYTSIDIVLGPGVDKLGDAATYLSPTPVDTVVCCEVLEHSNKWADIVKAAGRVLDPVTGVLILTCATIGRAPHSSVDGAQVREGEYYGNVQPLELTAILDMAGFEEHETTVLEQEGDLQVIAWKKART